MCWSSRLQGKVLLTLLAKCCTENILVIALFASRLPGLAIVYYVDLQTVTVY